MKMKITCKEATDFISKKEEKRLSIAGRIQLWRHLMVCSLCRLFYRQNKVITKAVSGLDRHDTALSEAQKNEIIETLKNTGSSEG